MGIASITSSIIVLARFEFYLSGPYDVVLTERFATPTPCPLPGVVDIMSQNGDSGVF